MYQVNNKKKVYYYNLLKCYGPLLCSRYFYVLTCLLLLLKCLDVGVCVDNV